MAQIHLSLKPTSLQCPTLEKLNLTINSPLKEGFISNHSLCLATCPLMLKRQLKRGGKKSCLLPCMPDCLCILHLYNTQCPAKHGGAAKSECLCVCKCKTGWHHGIWLFFLLCHLDWCFVLGGWLCLPLPSVLSEVRTFLRCLCINTFSERVIYFWACNYYQW